MMSSNSNRQNNHTLPSAVRFFKIITKTSLQHATLRIPNCFTRKYGDDMSNPMFLKTPDDKQWNIHWTKHDGDILFQKGWKEFTTYYSLDHGHMVLFEYEETSHFGVRIFDKSTLEIQYPFHGSQDEQNNQINRSSVEISDELAQCKKTRPKSPMSCPQPHKKLKTDTSEDGERSSKMQNLLKHVQVKEEKDTSTTECQQLDQEQEQLTSKSVEALNKGRNLISKRNLRSKSAEALNKAKNWRSKNPSFVVVMKSSYVHQYLYVPLEFAKEYVKKNQSDILLEVLDGRTWPVKYCLRRIGVGWKTFVLDNNLKVGDVCRFELTNCEAITLKVLFFRLGDESQSLPPQGIPKSVQGEEVNLLDPAKIPDVESKTIITNKGEKASKKNSPQTNEAGEETNKALKEANKFTSENPFFMFGIEPDQQGRGHRPHIPSPFMKKYLNKKQTVVLMFWEKFWHVKLNYCPCKPTARLSRGWHLFKEISELKAGDACVFELINREDAVFDVHIFRGPS